MVASGPPLSSELWPKTMSNQDAFRIPLAAAAVSGLAILSSFARSSSLNARKTRLMTPAIYHFRAARVLTCLALWILSVVSALQMSKQPVWHPQVLVFTYAFFLSGLSLLSRQWGKVASRHTNIMLLVMFAVYAYRDLWPFATYTERPRDLEFEGPVVLWAKVTLLAFGSIVIPLFIPQEYIPEDSCEGVSPVQTAPIISLVVYSYLDPLVLEANRVSHLGHNRVPPLPGNDRTKQLRARSFPYLDSVQGASSRHIFFGLARIFGWDYVYISLIIIVQAFANFASPLAVNRILSSLERDGAGDTVRIWVWVLCLFLGQTVVSLCFQWYHYLATSVLVRAQSMLTQLIFEHSLRIRLKGEKRNSGDKDASAESMEAKVQDNLAGMINTLVTVDLDNIIGAKDGVMLFVQVPMELTLAGIFLYNVLGWSAILGCATTLILLPVPGYIAAHMQKILATKMQKTDARVQSVTEAVGVMRMIKMFGWESKTAQTINEKRDEELSWLWKSKILSLLNDMINFTIPILTMLVTFATYTLLMKQNLTPSKVFSSMPVFTMIRFLLHHASWLVSQIVKARVSLDRVDAFLRSTELIDEYEASGDLHHPACGGADPRDMSHDSDIEFNDVSFVWSKDDMAEDAGSPPHFTLQIDGYLAFKKNAINLIVGPTGCGKTSILMALLGEMKAVPRSKHSRACLPRVKGVAYVAQESWVLNETIRENILFGSAYNEGRYRTVIHQCALERDLELFKAGDKTEVGEKGLTLSGGQKARITLARAVYSSAGVLLLDDILAALDVHTSKWIVDKCLKGDLIRGRTVLLVTHNVPLVAPIADFIVTVGEDGRVREAGSNIAALIDNQIPADHGRKGVDSEGVLCDVQESDPPRESAASVETHLNDGRLVLDEELAHGRIGWNAIMLFLQSLGGKHPFLNFGFWIVGFIFLHGGNLLALWFLGYWGSQYETHDPADVPVTKYLGVYSAILFTSITVYNLGAAVWYRMTIKSSRTINALLVDSLLRAPLRWLDKTPVSRIVSRCTQDIGALDSSLTLPFSAIVDLTLCIIIRLLGPVILTPILLIPGTVVIITGIWLGNVYLKAQMSIKREMSNARSPVLAHFGATTSGLVSIRAYAAEAKAIITSIERIDQFAKLSRTSWALNCWISVRIDLLGALFTTSLASYLLYTRTLSAANIGFSLNIALEFTIVILWLVRWYNEFEVQANSLERIQEYLEIEHEPRSAPSGRPPAAWPTSGRLRVEHLSARYSSDGPKVLHDLFFEVKAGERVGIVGRTGSGKSSLTLSLLRCIITEGHVYFDDYRTDRLNLEDLRSNITIIPQIPELLSGTLRRNLDPFDEHDDSTLNNSLRDAGLFSLHPEDEPTRLLLDSDISAGGSNLSVGQRQIIALARAIVRNSKLLILDEATSAIDHATDNIIQASLRTKLGDDVTVLTIAHRLQTIMDADRVMVLENGRIVEFDKPVVLLAKQNGLFKALVDESNDRDALYAIAREG